MQNLKSFSFLIGILVIHQLWVMFIQGILHPVHFTPHNFFILELIGKKVNIPTELIFFLDTANIILIWLISRRIFAGFNSFIPAVIYATLPWSGYLVAAKSFYILLAFLTLLIFYGFLLINSKEKRPFWESILTITATTFTIYGSLLMLFIVPLLFIVIYIFRIFPTNNLRSIFYVIIVLSLPLLISIYVNILAFQNILQREITIFSDPGLINMANSYQGAARQANLGILARTAENKYIIHLEYIFLKLSKHLTPSTYFTSQEKLLNFSFTPPIYLGFIIPFAFGFYQILKSPHFIKWLILSVPLVIPSMLSKQMVDLNRLFILLPVLILIITFGSIFLFKQKKNIYLALIGISIFMVIFQAFVTISDIQLREKARFVRYFGDKIEIGIQ